MYLGLDLGTSELKALLLGDDHRIAGVARAPLTVQRPQPLWSEQAPGQWWEALERVMAAAARGACAPSWRRCAAIGLSGQMHGAVLLDARDHVLRPAILWNDGRSGAQCDELTRARAASSRGSPATWRCRASPRPSCCGCASTSPSCSRASRSVLLPKDWLRLQLSGEARRARCPTPRARCGSMSAARDWSRRTARRHRPRAARTCRALVEGSEASGAAPARARRALGAAAAGRRRRRRRRQRRQRGRHGRRRAGQGFVSLGTSGVIFVADDRFRAESRRGGARLLPCAAGALAPDVGDAVGRQLR